MVAPVSNWVMLAGKVEKIPRGPPEPVKPYAASEICEPRPAKNARPSAESEAVTTSPDP